jgi:hypothetical protein
MHRFGPRALVITSLTLLSCTKFASSPDAGSDAAHDTASAGSGGSGGTTGSPDTAPETPSTGSGGSGTSPDAAPESTSSPPDAADAADGPLALPLGHACTADHDCASGHCATGVCCDQACAGPCAQCSPAGACQMPADDPACGTIACPADTACRDYATSITAGRCKALGQCKSAADCTFLDAPAQAPCGLPSRCNGSGGCVAPTVTCGGDGECSVDVNRCCVISGQTMCLPDCGGPHNGNISCDETSDCVPGSICCAYNNTGVSGVACMPPAQCVSDQGTLRQQVCKPANTGECLTGACTLVAAGPAGYVCK